jgi:tripartite ATP-independent transporter DctM subunit
MFFYIISIILVLIFLKIPIVFSFGIGSAIYCVLTNINLLVVPQRMFVILDGFTLLAIPFFVLAGNLMNIGGVTMRILILARSLVGHIIGGLGQVNVVASMIFAGLSGSGIADAAGLGVIEMKMMTESGYDKDFSAAITLASSTIGPIIPPSIVMVLYATASNASIGKLLIGGIIPGIIMGICLMIMVYFISKKKNYPVDSWGGFKQIFRAISQALLPLFTPVIIVGGIVGGIFTPTEAGAVGALYALILGLFVYKEITWGKLKKVFFDTAMTTATIGIIIGVSAIFSWMITIENIPQNLVSFIFSMTTNKILILALINFIILILGCFIDGGPLIILLVPVLLPLLNNMNINLVHFGIVMCVNIMIGAITPPVGSCLFAVSTISKLPVERIARQVLPFLFMLIIALIIMTYIPQISLFLPNLLFR